MSTSLRTPARVILSMLLAVGLAAISVGDVSAQEISYGSTVPAGTTVDQDIFLTGDEVTIDGTVLGDVIAVGGKVAVNGRVEGTLIAIAQDIELNGQVGGSLLAAALQVLAGPEASVGKNLYFAGLSLVMPVGATVGRDLVAATLGATLGGQIGRDVRAIVGPFEFARLIIGAAEEGDWLGQAQAWWESVRPAPAPQALPTAPAPSSSAGGGILMRVRQLPSIQATETPAAAPVSQPTVAAPVGSEGSSGGEAMLEGALAWLQGRLYAFLPLASLGLLVLWLFPASLTHSAGRLQRKPLPTVLWGFLVFVVANQLFVVAAILSVLVIVLGLAIGLQSMWGFGFSIWAIGLSGIGLAASLLAVALFGLSLVIPGYAVIGKWMDPGDTYLRRAGVMLLGVLVIVLLLGIPVLGVLLWIAALAAGSGAMFFAYTDWRARRKSPEGAEQPAAIPAPLPAATAPNEALPVVVAPAAAAEKPPRKPRK